MYYFTIKNNTIYDNNNNVSLKKDTLSLYIFDYVNGILYEKRYLHNKETLLRKTTLNNILEYFSTYDERIQWNYFEDFEDFNKCNEIIIEWDFYLDGHRITYLQNILYKAITEIRNQKIEQILNE